MTPSFLYKAVYFIGLFLSIIINLILASKERKKIGKSKNFETRLKTIKPIHTTINAVIIFICGVLGAMLMSKFYNNLFDATGNVSLFGSLILPPIVMFFYYKIMRFDWKYAMDFLAVEVYIILGFSKIGCNIAGCCGGRFLSSTGSYFPIQIYESISIFIIAALCILYIYKEKKAGFLYPLATMLYSLTRFGWEFLRYYDKGSKESSFFIGLTFWQCMAIGVFVASAIWALLMHTASKKKELEAK